MQSGKKNNMRISHDNPQIVHTNRGKEKCKEKKTIHFEAFTVFVFYSCSCFCGVNVFMLLLLLLSFMFMFMFMFMFFLF